MISDASSGGVFSKVCFIMSTIFSIESFIASWTCVEVIIAVSGRPVAKCLPLISMLSSVNKGLAHPIFILTCSAVVSPIAKFISLFT